MSFFAPRLDRITLSASNAATQRVRELRAAGRDIVDLTIGQPDFETPPHVKQAVASALEALDLIRDGHAFDLAILDLSMPQMDGMQLARAIRQTRDAQTLPLVLLTSMGQRPKQAEAEGAEFSAYLHKPIKPAQLLDTLMTLIGGGR